MTNAFSLRPARATDLPAIYLGELDYIRLIEPEQEARWKDGMRWHLEQWTRSLGRMVVLEREGRVIGYSFWEVTDGEAVLASIHVATEHRGKGLGTVLLNQYINDAKAKGFQTLALGVKPENPARILYERAGFLYSHDTNGYRHYKLAGVW